MTSRGFNIPTKAEQQKDIRKDVAKMEALLNMDMKLQEENAKELLSSKSIGETIIEVRRGASNIYGICMSINHGENDLQGFLAQKGKTIFDPGFEDIVKIINQINELAKLLPEEFKLELGETSSRKAIMDEHRKLVNTLKNYSEFNSVNNVRYDKSISQYIGDNVIKYYKQMEKEALDTRSIDTIHRKISAILYEVQKEYGKMYTKTKIATAAFESLQQEKQADLNVFKEVSSILTDLKKLKDIITQQIEHVTKQLVVIINITNLDKDIQKNLQESKKIIDEELYTVRQNQPQPEAKRFALKVA